MPRRSSRITKIEGIEGEVYIRGHSGYDEHRYQYATSSHDENGSMQPAMVIYPESVDDIIRAVEYAKEKQVAVAVRTGGHQYSGASSTSGNNIQLDMSRCFLDDFDYDDQTNRLRTGISFNLGEFNTKLGEHGLFMPHGQCSHVHVGGHCQTGGYGQLGRSFGLFGDHIVEFEIVVSNDENGNVSHKKVTKESDPDLFYAVLGGSPGNYGVLTHLTIEPHRVEDHPNSRGLKMTWIYRRERVQNLLQVLADMSRDEELPRDIDYCVTVLSSSQKVIELFPTFDDDMRTKYPEIYGEDNIKFWPPMIIVYLQWANTQGPNQKFDAVAKSWFKKVEDAGNGVLGIGPVSVELDGKSSTPMNTLTRAWVFENVREFDLPYEKRTYMTPRKDIDTKWATWVTDRIDEIQSDITNGCKLSIQIQPFGGKHSKFFTNRNNGTAYSWRDSSICCVMDCFYDPKFPRAKATALEWQKQNDREAIGPKGKFSPEDRRVLWGSYGTMDLNSVWDTYYETGEKYDRLCHMKRKIDPDNVFTPNGFCVQGRPTPRLLQGVTSLATSASATRGLTNDRISKIISAAHEFVPNAQANSKEPWAAALAATKFLQAIHGNDEDVDEDYEAPSSHFDDAVMAQRHAQRRAQLVKLGNPVKRAPPAVPRSTKKKTRR